MYVSFQVPAYCIIFAQPICKSNPGAEGRELSVLTTTPASLQQCSDKMQIFLYLNSNTSYICSKCLIDILPFQQVCDVEFKEMFDQNIFKQITSTLNNEPNQDDLIKPNCKYRGVEWYKKCLTNSKNQNGLSIIHFNVRSIVKINIYYKNLLWIR